MADFILKLLVFICGLELIIYIVLWVLLQFAKPAAQRKRENKHKAKILGAGILGAIAGFIEGSKKWYK